MEAGNGQSETSGPWQDLSVASDTYVEVTEEQKQEKQGEFRRSQCRKFMKPHNSFSIQALSLRTPEIQQL